MSHDTPQLDHAALRRILNSYATPEHVRAIAYNLLNLRDYQPTDDERLQLFVALVKGAP